MTDDPGRDAYRTLQVDPGAHQVVIRAAYLALARRYHPDGDAPDPVRMADLNHAYDQIRDEQRRRLYDARRAVFSSQAPSTSGSTPVGPGRGSNGAPPGAADRPVPVGVGAFSSVERTAADVAGPFRRARPDGGGPESSLLDFGRYAGWSLRDLARQDPDYLRWLSRHSSGLRYRQEILRLLPDASLGHDRR
jgi:curved DNA-binding protein CbpA